MKPPIVIPNMKFFSRDAVIVVEVGLVFFSTFMDVVIEVLLTVLTIMLANPTMITTIIPMERIPPVTVWY